jgi:hypothetical protein
MKSIDVKCPFCDKYDVTETVQTQEFPYGVGSAQVTLSAEVTVFECSECDLLWTDYTGDEARDAAIHAHNKKLDELQPPRCNKHTNCDLADQTAKDKGTVRPYHCYNEDCEDCFGQ